MRSTGEVMGIAPTYGEAFAKSQLSSGQALPKSGNAFVSVRDFDKKAAVNVAKRLIDAGFNVVATNGTAKVLEAAGLPCQRVNKVNEGRPHIIDMIKNDEINFIVNTTEGEQAIADSYIIRRGAIQHKICYTTTLAGAEAVCSALQYNGASDVNSLQDLHK
ncbi:MAG: carbamoyl phosphate synthase large subunit, partial [Coxiellaceae bacterium]|nr:carbamoyl phosphate synthase large subunit [Coxiellaceae bacterium]